MATALPVFALLKTSSHFPIKMNMVRKTTESKYVVLDPAVPFLIVASIPNTAMDEKYATDVPMEMRRFMLPNRRNRRTIGTRLLFRHRDRISLKART